jgi:hypothetical protein
MLVACRTQGDPYAVKPGQHMVSISSDLSRLDIPALLQNQPVVF